MLDGTLIFSAADEALYFDTDQTYTPYVTDRILVSTNATGAGKTVWDSTMGIVAGNELDYTDFAYVELIGNGVIDPGTGDAAQPWLWVFVGAAAVFAGAVVLYWLLHKRRD